jgi:hypothetical protein
MAEVLPRNVLLRISGRNLEQYNTLALAGASRGRAAPLPFTFTRSSVGYFLDRDGIIRKAAADKIRDYWPVGLVDSQGRRLHGPLIESARTNGWATVTENYADGAWAKLGTTVSANATTAPDGVGVADKIVESAVNEMHRVGRTFAGATDNTRSSVWFLVKPAERTWCFLRSTTKAGTSVFSWFNLSGSGVLGTKAAAHDVWIRPLGSLYGYYFVAASVDVGTGGGTPDWSIGLATADNVQVYAGDGASGLYVWESGVEVDKPFPSYPGSILPNGLARTVDAASLLYNFGPVDGALFGRVARPLYCDSPTGPGGANGAGIFTLGNAGEPRIEIGFDAGGGKPFGGIRNGTGRFSVAAAVPAGNEIAFVSRFRNFPTGPTVQTEVAAGNVTESAASIAFSAFGNQTLLIGKRGVAELELNSVLLDGMFIRGLPSLAEALAASDA